MRVFHSQGSLFTMDPLCEGILQIALCRTDESLASHAAGGSGSTPVLVLRLSFQAHHSFLTYHSLLTISDHAMKRI